MGVWSGFLAFDQEQYDTIVLPAMREGQSHPLVQEFCAWHKENRTCGGGAFHGLAALSTQFSADYLQFEGDKTAIKFPFPEELVQDCHGYEIAYWDYEDLCALFEYLIARHCVKFFTHFGLGFPFFNNLITHPEPFQQKLIQQCAQNATFWQHGGGGFAEGIHGFFKAEEVQLLSSELHLHPDYTAASIQSDRYEKKLPLINAFINQAKNQNTGLIWGNDLDLFYALEWENREFGEIIEMDWAILGDQY